MPSVHLVTRLRGYLKFNDSRTLTVCKSCSKSEINLHSSFTVFKKCLSEYNGKIREAPLNKANHFLMNSYMPLVFFAKNILICLIPSQFIHSLYLLLFRYLYRCFIIPCLIRHNPQHLITGICCCDLKFLFIIWLGELVQCHANCGTRTDAGTQADVCRYAVSWKMSMPSVIYSDQNMFSHSSHFSRNQKYGLIIVS